MNFNLWLILHKIDCSKCVSNNDDYDDDLRKVYNLPKNADVKNMRNITKIMEALSLEDIKAAVNRGKILNVNQQNYGQALTGLSNHYCQPCVLIARFLDKVIEDVGL